LLWWWICWSNSSVSRA